jgi:hypothetical protein
VWQQQDESMNSERLGDAAGEIMFMVDGRRFVPTVFGGRAFFTIAEYKVLMASRRAPTFGPPKNRNPPKKSEDLFWRWTTAQFILLSTYQLKTTTLSLYTLCRDTPCHSSFHLITRLRKQEKWLKELENWEPQKSRMAE